ncbi:MAG: O-antigen ligase family protein, partial [bacterium]|nr:O-antigen ligase family protein [bacterium]
GPPVLCRTEGSRSSDFVIGAAGARSDLLSAALRWLLVVGVAFVPLVFDPGHRLLEAKWNAVWAVGGLVAVLWVLRWLLDRRSSPGLELRLALPALALAAALGVATWQAANPHVAFWGARARGEGLVTIFCYLAVAFVTAHELREAPGFQRRFTAALLIGAAGNALYAMVQFAGLDPVWGFRGYLRPFAMQGNAAFLAGYLAMAVPVAAAAAIAVGSRPARTGMVLLVGLLFLGLLVTGSRAAWAASWLGFGLFAAAVLARHGASRRRWAAAVGAVMLALTLLYAAQAGPFARTIDEQVLARVAKDGGTLRLVPGEIHPDARRPAQRLAMTLEYGGGVAVRVFIWRGAVSAWLRRPWLGQGLDSFRYFPNLSDPREAKLYAGRTLPPLFYYDRVENEFLEMAVAAGVLGLAAYLWLLGALLVPSLRAAAGGDLVAAGATAAAVAFLLVLQVQPGFLGSSFVFWSLLGFGAARARPSAPILGKQQGK